MKLTLPALVPRLLSIRVVRYGLSGLLSFCIENLFFSLFFYAASLNYVASNIGSVGIALTVNFFVSKHFVFQSAKKNSTKEFVKYLILIACNLTASTFLIGTLLRAGVQGYVAKFVVTIIVVSWTYIIYNKVIFKER